MTCNECLTGHLGPSSVSLTGEFRGEEITVRMEGLSCPACGYQTVHGTAMAEFMRRAADAYREKHGLLTSQGIKSRRERLGMSQERFAKYLGVSVPSIKRWELGQVQDRAMNRLLLLMTDLETAEANAVEVRRRLTPEPLATEPGGETRFSSAGHMRENLRGQQPSA